MRILNNVNQALYVSYKTHRYCRVCELWQEKIETEPNQRCSECNGQLRRKPRFTKDEDRWNKAY